MRFPKQIVGQASGGNEQTCEFNNSCQESADPCCFNKDLNYSIPGLFRVVLSWPTPPLASPKWDSCQVKNDVCSLSAPVPSPAKFDLAFTTISYLSEGLIFFTCWSACATWLFVNSWLLFTRRDSEARAVKEGNCISSALCLASKREWSGLPRADRWARRTSFIWFKHSRGDLLY